MYSFKNDYSEGAHLNILNALVEANLEQSLGYGEDAYTQRAVELLKEKIGRRDSDIHLLVGGTQTNLTAISAFLRPHEAVIAACTGHVATHETGAIEATGHKVITTQTKDGKLTPSHIKAILEEHIDEHMVKPRLVYISNATEIGTVYKKVELECLSQFCKENKLFLFIDGARLGVALTSIENDMTLLDLGHLADAFYIGGTKNGALMGEALVICNDALKEDFRYHIKQKGALLAKGRLLGIQFLELFKGNLFFELAQDSNDMATLLKQGITDCGYPFYVESFTNQLFPIFPNELIGQLEKEYAFINWTKVDDAHQAVRLVTSWATSKEAVEGFIKHLKKL